MCVEDRGSEALAAPHGQAHGAAYSVRCPVRSAACLGAEHIFAPAVVVGFLLLQHIRHVLRYRHAAISVLGFQWGLDYVSMFYDERLEVFNSAGFVPKIGVEAERSHIAEMVLDGMGITICSNTAPYKKQSVCLVIQLEDTFCRRCTYLIWQDRDNRSSAIQAFIDFVSDIKQEMEISKNL